MAKIILITGGARSGKSEFAENLARQFPNKPYYIATSEVFDEEMRQRVALHQARRQGLWHELHAPLDLSHALKESDNDAARLVDCVTLWVNNLIYHQKSVQDECDALCAVLNAQSAPVILVTNELGMGIVPDNRLSREFRDWAGRVNQMLAEIANEVHFIVCGQSLKIK